jgi:hypothetical protein
MNDTELRNEIQKRIKKYEHILEIIKEEQKTKAVTSEHTFDSDIARFYRYERNIAILQDQIELLEDLLK